MRWLHALSIIAWRGLKMERFIYIPELVLLNMFMELFSSSASYGVQSCPRLNLERFIYISLFHHLLFTILLTRLSVGTFRMDMDLRNYKPIYLDTSDWTDVPESDIVPGTIYIRQSQSQYTNTQFISFSIPK